MRRLIPFVAYAVAAFALACLLTYPVWRLAVVLGWRDAPVHELALRLFQLGALACLWPLLRRLGLHGASAWGYGRISGAREAIRASALGFGAGVLVLVPVVLVLVGLGARVVRPEWEPVAITAVALTGLAAGAVVAVLEETWFRGALHGAVERVWSVSAAVSATSLLYAAVHFVRADVPVAADSAGWTSGAFAIAHSFHRFEDPAAIVDSFAALAAAGLLLSLVRTRTGRIWECIGLHAGWVCTIRVARELTRTDPDAHWGWLAGGYDGVIGWLAGAWFAALALAWWRLAPRIGAS